MTYARLAEAVLAIFAGALWVASNTDTTVPAERGLLPGAGATVAFVQAATKATPQVAGKPERALHEESTIRSGAKHPLVVGDRLDTDIEGANRAGVASLLVLTGVSTPADLLPAPPHLRPTYLAADLRALLRAAPDVPIDSAGDAELSARCGPWVARAAAGTLQWSRQTAADGAGSGDGDSDGDERDDGLDALRAGLAVHWAAADAGHPVSRVEGTLPAGCEAFGAAQAFG